MQILRLSANELLKALGLRIGTALILSAITIPAFLTGISPLPKPASQLRRGYSGTWSAVACRFLVSPCLHNSVVRRIRRSVPRPPQLSSGVRFGIAFVAGRTRRDLVKVVAPRLRQWAGSQMNRRCSWLL